MLKKAVRIISIVLVLSILISGNAYAATDASKYIITYSGYCHRASSTTVQVYFDITAKHVVDQLGATQIRLYESSDLSSWSLLKTYYYTSYSNMMVYNDFTMGSHVNYTNALSDRYYKATISFIAVYGTDSETRTLNTPYI